MKGQLIKKIGEIFKWRWLTTVALVVYVLTPACGSKNSSTNNNPGSVVCTPGQVCTTVASGFPLLPTPTYSALDPSRQSTMILTWAAPVTVTAGQPYNGTVNVGGVITLAPGICAGLPSGGTIQVNGTGNWEAGYGGYIARVQASMNIVSGGVGTVSLSPALVAPYSGGSYAYMVTYGADISIPFCGHSFTYYN